MGKTATNLAVLLGLTTIVFAGYYLFTQEGSDSLVSNTDTQTMENMLNNTRVFIERRKVLDSMELNVGLFEDDKFRSLKTFTKPVQEQPIGRSDPFADTITASRVPDF